MRNKSFGSQTILQPDDDAASRPPADFARRSDSAATPFTFRKPRAEDGPAISALIAACPPLDANSAYCNLLQCTDFADTCVVAEREGRLAGWISAYRPPASPDRLFVWQVAVDEGARGEGLGGRMIEALVARPEAAGATALTTTVTADNKASWALFEGFARRHGMAISRAPRFERDRHFAGAHATEWQATIGPLAGARAPHPHQDQEPEAPTT